MQTNTPHGRASNKWRAEINLNANQRLPRPGQQQMSWNKILKVQTNTSHGRASNKWALEINIFNLDSRLYLDLGYQINKEKIIYLG